MWVVVHTIADITMVGCSTIGKLYHVLSTGLVVMLKHFKLFIIFLCNGMDPIRMGGQYSRTMCMHMVIKINHLYANC